MPPAPLPAPPSAAAFSVTYPPPAVGVHALHEDRAHVPVGCPLVPSLAYLEWDIPAAPAQPSAPRYQLAGETRGQRDGLPALPSHGTNGPTAALGDSAGTATPESTQPGPRALQRSNSNRHT